MRCLYSTPHLSALRSRQNKGPKISRARGSGQHQENTCSQDRRGLMHTLSSQSCNSIHKNCGGSGQTQGQEGEGGVGTKSQLQARSYQQLLEEGKSVFFNGMILGYINQTLGLAECPGLDSNHKMDSMTFCAFWFLFFCLCVCLFVYFMKDKKYDISTEGESGRSWRRGKI